MEQPDTTPSTCLNCEETLAGNYCSNCGQSASVHRITFQETISDFFSSTLALQGPLIFTITQMIVNPGKLIRSFIEGKRRKYYKPVAFFVVLTAIYLLVRSVIDYDPFQGQARFQEGGNVPEQAKKFIDAGRFMVANINNIMFFLVLSIGLSHKIFFSKKYNLAEYVTYGFFISGIYVLIGLVHMIWSTYVIFFSPRIVLLILFIYLLYTSFSFHQSKSFWSITRYLLIAMLSIALYIAMGYGFSLFIVTL